MSISLRKFWVLLFPVLAYGQGAQLPKYTVANLPSASSLPSYVVQVTDGENAADCSVGGGSINVLCKSQGGSWVSQSPFQSLTTTGSGGATLSGGVLNIPPSGAGTLTTNNKGGLSTLSGTTLNVPAYPQGNVYSPPNFSSLVGAFTDSSGDVIEPVALGNGPTTFSVPAGATQLQLGINDNDLSDTSGSWVVSVNGTNYTVGAKSAPWLTTGGINARYPIVVPAATGTTVATIGVVGTPVTVQYVSGTIANGAICGGSGSGPWDASGQPNCVDDDLPSVPGYWTVAAPSLGAVSSVSNSDGSLTISPTTGAVVASINYAHAGTWTALETFSTGVSASALTLSAITGSTQCLHVNTSGVVSGTGSDCGSGGGGAFSGGLGASYQDVGEIAAPANPASGNERLYASNSTHQLACVTSSGGNCLPTGGGGSAYTTILSPDKNPGTVASSEGKAVSLTAGSTMDLVHLFSGTGYITINSIAVEPFAKDAEIIVTVNGEGTPSIDLNLGYLLGAGPGGYACLGPYFGRWFSLNCAGTSSDDSYGGSFRLPIPYSTSVHIQLKNNGAGTASVWYDISNHEGVTDNFTYTQHLYAATVDVSSIAANTETAMANVTTTKAGVLAAVAWTYDGSPGSVSPLTAPLEGPFRVYVDGSVTASYVASGSEGFFGMPNYFTGTTAFGRNTAVGGTNTLAPSSSQIIMESQTGSPNTVTWQASRVFENDPIEFNTGLKVTWQCGVTSVVSFTGTCTLLGTVFYYTQN